MSEFESLMSDANHNDERQLESALRGLTLRAPQLDTAQLMFEAGRRAGLTEHRTRLRRWQISTAALTVCTLLLAVSLLQPAPDRAPELMVEQPATPAASEPQVVSHDPAPPSPETPEPTPVAVVESETSPPSPLASWWRSLTQVNTPADAGYLSLRNRVLERGVDALPPSTGGGTTDSNPLSTSPDRLREYLDLEFSRESAPPDA